MRHIFKRTAHPSALTTAGRAACVAMFAALAACGGSSDSDGAGNGAQLRAASGAVPVQKERPNLPDAAAGTARRATPFDPIANSINPAMQKLARLQCAKRARISPGVDKARYAEASTWALREDNCAVVLAVSAGTDSQEN